MALYEISSFSSPAKRLQPHDSPAPRTVLAHGCFDRLHLGHIRHLQEARTLGDRLVVSVTADEHVNKGIGRPRFPAYQRVEALRALACVDEAFLHYGPDAVGSIEAVKPAVYVKGVDYEDKSDPALQREVEAIEKIGGTLHITKSKKWSSTRLINEETLSDQVLAYLDSAKVRDFLPKIHQAFEAADKLTIAFVGETILDEYRYIRALGKPAKEACLATVELDREIFEGGVVAASLHGGWFRIETVTVAEAIRKTRFVDQDFSRKIFEVYTPQRLTLSTQAHAAFQAKLRSAIKHADVVIAFDFGHGLIDRQAIRLLDEARFLAVNAQSNAGNYGFNRVTKYLGPDLISIDDPEARLAADEQFAPPETVIAKLAQEMEYRAILVTHGQQPTLAYDGTKIAKIPALTIGRVDTMGAGDAFLTVAAPLVAAGLELEAAALVGNVAGAIKCSILGHRRAVERQEILKTIEALLA